MTLFVSILYKLFRMKKSFFLLIAVLLISCSKDEIEDSSLSGKWILNDVFCFCFFPEDYDFSTSRLIFDTANDKLLIENDGEIDFIDEPGTYRYSGDGNRITLENGRSYIFEVEGNILRFTFVDEPNIADDEITYLYTRN